MSEEQFTLNLSSPESDPAGSIRQHSIRVPKNQKIKNLGLLGRKILAPPESENAWNARAAQILSRFGDDPELVVRSVAARLAKKESEGSEAAWDWQGWEERFFQVLWFRRFLAHPALYSMGPEDTPVPSSWFFAPREGGAGILPAVAAWKLDRAVAGVRLDLQYVHDSLAWELFTELSPFIDAEATRLPKPYPELQVILPAHHPDVARFLELRASERRQCRRVVGIRLAHEQGRSFGAAALLAIHEPLFREVHGALREGLETCVIILEPEEVTPGLLRQESVCAGAINVKDFTDSGEERFLADELVAATSTGIRILSRWFEAATPDTPLPWLGVTGFADALEALGLDFADPRALVVARNLGLRLRREVAQVAQRSAGLGQRVPAVRAAHSRYFAQLGDVTPGLLPQDPDFSVITSLEVQAAFAGTGVAQAEAVIRKAGQLEVEAFLAAIAKASQQGWKSVRCY